MKKIIIFAYLEGASGIDHAHFCSISADGKCSSEFACGRLVADANAAAEAVVRAGAEAYVCDVTGVCAFSIAKECSGKERNTMIRFLTPSAKRITLGEATALCKSGADGAIIVGAHAMNGAENAFASYTVNDVSWQDYSVNGKKYGDIGIAAMFFGAYNVPIIAVSGDLAAVNECKSLVGDIPAAVVKTAVVRNVARTCLPTTEAETLIGKTCENAVKTCAERKPYVVNGPFVARLVHTRSDYCDEAMAWYVGHDEISRVSTLVVEKRVEKIVNYDDLII